MIPLWFFTEQHSSMYVLYGSPFCSLSSTFIAVMLLIFRLEAAHYTLPLYTQEQSSPTTTVPGHNSPTQATTTNPGSNSPITTVPGHNSPTQANITNPASYSPLQANNSTPTASTQCNESKDHSNARTEQENTALYVPITDNTTGHSSTTSNTHKLI